MRPCILDCNGNLIGESENNLGILGFKGIRFCALHIQNADELISDLQGKSHFGAGFGEVRVVFESRVSLNVQRNAGGARSGNMAYNPCLTDLESVSPRQHFLAALAVRGTQDRILTWFIQEENTHMVET